MRTLDYFKAILALIILLNVLSLYRFKSIGFDVPFFDEMDFKSTTRTNTAAPTNLNPFKDITLFLRNNSESASGSRKSYSSHQCVESYQHGAVDWTQDTLFVSRTCEFTNLFYNPHEEIFHYFPSPQEQVLLAKDDYYQNLITSLTVAISHVLSSDARTLSQIPPYSIWQPKIHRTYDDMPDQYAVISSPKNLLFLLWQPYRSENIGHFILDDILPLFSMMDIFGLVPSSKTSHDANPNNIFPLPFFVNQKKPDKYHRVNPLDENRKDYWEKSAKTLKRVFPSFFHIETHPTGDILRTGNWLKGMGKEYFHGVPIDIQSDNTTSKTNDDGSDDEESKSWNEMLPDTSYVLRKRMVQLNTRCKLVQSHILHMLVNLLKY